MATPIGHLDDITFRAIETLRGVDVIAAEDTRRTGNLLRHFNIETSQLSLHGHNEHRRIPQVLDRLRAGQAVALVTDAGTPAISDPGADVVAAARAEGFAVVPVPGASSVIAALSASGLPSARFAFAGFPPIRSKDRNGWFAWVSKLSDVPVVMFEAPHRLHRTLDDLDVLVKRPITMARELTKLHEQWLRGSAAALRREIVSPQGEYVLVIEPALTLVDEPAAATDDEIRELFGRLTETTASNRREAIRATAEQLKLSPNAVYDALERTKGPV